MTVFGSIVSPRDERFRGNAAQYDATLRTLRAALSHSLGGGRAHVARHHARGKPLVRDAAIATWLPTVERSAPGPWAALGGFRVMEQAGRPARLFLKVHDDTGSQPVTVTGNAASFAVEDGEAAGATMRDGIVTLRSRTRMARFATARHEGAILLSAGSETRTRRVLLVAEAATGARATVGGPRLTAPMPGLVVAVQAAEGDRVEAGQIIAVMEAMEVIMRLPAPVAGRVLRVACAAAETVKAGDLLIEIEPDGGAWMAGLFFEELTVGTAFDHPWRRTVAETDNVLFSSMTMNPARPHLDACCAAGTEFGQIIVNSLFTLGLMIGMTVNDTTLGTTTANLGMTDVRFPKPVFRGDILGARTVALMTCESRSRPNAGVVEFEHTATNHRGEVVAACRRQALMLKRPAPAP